MSTPRPAFRSTHCAWVLPDPSGDYDDPGFLAAVTAFTPMGRIVEAEEIRGPALFLASPASDFMTGQTLVMDGGCLAK